jgi:predicted nucleotidyltransferase
MTNDIKVKQIINEILDRILTGYEPKKVILFGSYAYGEPTKDSDLDILIVTERHFTPEETYKIRRKSLGHYDIPIQLICLSDEEFTETKDIIGGIAYPASKYGEILYEKS